jgi:microcin C transport system substrate-binding protein
MIKALFALALLLPAPALATECPAILSPAPEADRIGVHGLALHGEPALPAGFTSLPYLNPDAPKGGTVHVSGFGSFDNLNPFILKGEAGDNLGALFDTLMYQSEDEAFTQYGLLAQSVDMPADRSWVAYTLRPEAKFADGTPVKASDVVFTFNTLKEKGNPFYRTYYADVVKVEAEGVHKVKFSFKGPGNRELPLVMGQLPVLAEHDWKDKDFTATTLKALLGSGPYKIASLEQGRNIVYERRADYWGKDLAVNRGRYNFDKIIVDYYRDENVMLEAFKAGDIDFRPERVARLWATGYDFPAVKDGRVVKEEIKHENPQGMQGFVFNTRRAVFKDVRTRKALALLMDFEWMNANLFHGQYKRSQSYFSNSELASTGLPACEERSLLISLGDKLPSHVLDTAFKLPVTKGDGNIREQLKAASDLLKDAGYTVQKGIMSSADGKPLGFEVLLYDSAMERVVQPYLRNLERLGIKAKIRMVDTAQYQARLIDRDYDMIVGGFGQSLSPGNEQLGYWGSASADVTGSPNAAGVKDPAVDALVEKIIKAPTREALVDATRALDRVLLAGWYVVPQWHTSSYRVAYWNRFSHPARTAKYSLGWPDSWWLDPAKDTALKK